MGQYLGPPHPLFNNVAINTANFKPKRFVINDITLGATTIVTTSVAHDYVVGQNIRLLVPLLYGTYQLDQRKGNVISIPSTTQVEVNINSLLFDSFNTGIATSDNDSQIIAIGDYNSGQINTSGRINQTTSIEGSFINISPQ